MDLGFSPSELSAARHDSVPPAKLGECFDHQTQEPSEAEQVTEAAFNSQEVQTLAKESLDFLAGMAMPTVFKYFYPPVFISVWFWLCSFASKTRDFSQLALGLPRGFGKTTLIKLFVLYCILFTNKKFILVISSTATLAEN